MDISSFIIRFRVQLLLAVLAVTIFMAYHAKDVELSYEVARVVPDDDEDYKAYQEFKASFGEDGTIMVLGVKNPNFFKLDFFNTWYQLAEELKAIKGVDNVTSIFNAQLLQKESNPKSFKPYRIFPSNITSQKRLDSLARLYKSLPFYKDAFYNFNTNTTFIAIGINEDVLASKGRMALLNDVFVISDKYLLPYNIEAKYSGLPFIRTSVAEAVKSEMQFFSILSLIICASILLIFFRTISSVIFPIAVIFVIVIWSLGTVALFGFKINAVTSLIPPLIIIIGVPNFIYLVNKYHSEFKKHGDKMRAIHRIIQKIGVVTLMTNATTAIGFLVLAFTNSPVLKEFGLVAGINIMATFVVSIIVIPVFFSYLPEPSPKHTNYLEKTWMNKVLEFIDLINQKYRPWVFTVAVLLIVVSLIGITKLRAIGFVLDDIPKEKKVYKDLHFFEDNFGGVLPFEVVVNSGKEKGLNDIKLLQQISDFQDTLERLPNLSRSYSVVDLVKLSKQAYFNNNTERYSIPNSRERNFMLPYLENSENKERVMHNMVDSNQQIARISSSIADIGSIKTTVLLERLKGVANDIFDDDVEVQFTGISLLFVKNNEYLIKNLISSMILAFVIISILMGLLFRNARMILASLLPNFIPLLATAGIMGFMGIPLKPSTVLVFSIAFGISIDDALHFLAKYRQELIQHNWNISKTISVAMLETGRSMIYTSVVLFAGFSIFTLSDFGGTSALGFLTSITLLIAMVTNLILLPSLILSFFRTRSVVE